jgi:LmbE family N-acetylglucosaminyl deacetylase
MLELSIPRPSRRALRVLCLGAHCDDIDIGCGGTLLRLLASGRVEVTWTVFSAPEERARELRASAKRFLHAAVRSDVITHEFRDSYFPAQYTAIKQALETLRNAMDPDLIFTHHASDLHQDHRVISELTWNAFRKHVILEYEIPKYDGGLLPTNAFVRLNKSQVDRKVGILMQSYRSQLTKGWFTQDTFRGLMRIRGIEAASASGWAEGFHARKLCVA